MTVVDVESLLGLLLVALLQRLQDSLVLLQQLREHQVDVHGDGAHLVLDRVQQLPQQRVAADLVDQAVELEVQPRVSG